MFDAPAGVLRLRLRSSKPESCTGKNSLALMPPRAVNSGVVGTLYTFGRGKLAMRRLLAAPSSSGFGFNTFPTNLPLYRGLRGLSGVFVEHWEELVEI